MMTTTTRARLLHVALLFALCAALSACAGSPPKIATPTGFVALDEDELHGDTLYKAVSADGAVIVVRHQQNETFGTVAFWSEALSRELMQSRGYELLDVEEVRAGPSSGRWLHLRGVLAEDIFRYDVAVFVEGDDIYTVETAAPEAEGVYDAHKAAFAGAVQSFALP